MKVSQNSQISKLGVVRQRSVLRRVLRRFWEGFWGRVLRRVLRKRPAMGFTVKKGSEKGSEKGSQKGFWEGGFQKVPRTPPCRVCPLRRAPYQRFHVYVPFSFLRKEFSRRHFSFGLWWLYRHRSFQHVGEFLLVYLHLFTISQASHIFRKRMT